MIYPAFNRVIRILPKEDYIVPAEGEPPTLPDNPDFISPAGVLPFIHENLFQDEAERALYELIKHDQEMVKKAAINGEYDKVLDHLADLRATIDTFFDQVLVMTEQDDLRNNRLALLRCLASMFSLVADFSKLVE
jgi:glycyl-tRNA synthetase beta chain